MIHATPALPSTCFCDRPRWECIGGDRIPSLTRTGGDWPVESFDAEERDGKLTVSFKDIVEADMYSICARASSTEKRRLVIDFADVKFLSSSGIGRLVILFQYAKQFGVDVRRWNDSYAVREQFQITRMNRVVRLDDEV
jgi:anti-anti-sigma factor